MVIALDNRRLLNVVTVSGTSGGGGQVVVAIDKATAAASANPLLIHAATPSGTTRQRTMARSRSACSGARDTTQRDTTDAGQLTGGQEAGEFKSPQPDSVMPRDIGRSEFCRVTFALRSQPDTSRSGVLVY